MADLWWPEWQWDELFSEYLGFPLSFSFHQASVLILMLTLILPGETGKSSEPSHRAVLWTALFWVITQLNYNPNEGSSRLLRGESMNSRSAMLFVGYRRTIGSQTSFAVWLRNQLDVTFVLSFITPLQVAQHVSGNYVSIFRTWRLRSVIATCWYLPLRGS